MPAVLEITTFALKPDLDAIEWLRANVSGSPVIAEAHAPEYHWGSRMSVHTGLPTIVVNDSQAAAMAEWTFGHHETGSAMVVVKVGEGIGAGIVLGGRLYTGDDSGAGEIGHTRVTDDAIACRCGSSGCLETVASQRAVLERARQLAHDEPGWALAGATVTHASLQVGSVVGSIATAAVIGFAIAVVGAIYQFGS